MVERYSWLTDLQKPCVASLKKIYVEYSSFDIYEVHGDVWKGYEDRRWEVTEAIVSRKEETLKPWTLQWEGGKATTRFRSTELVDFTDSRSRSSRPTGVDHKIRLDWILCYGPIPGSQLAGLLPEAAQGSENIHIDNKLS